MNLDLLTYHDGFVVEAEALPELAVAGLAAPLDLFIMKAPALNWYRIIRYYRGFSALHDQQTYGVPVGGVGHMMYYRKDAFQRYNISVPRTWDDVLDIARTWKGRLDLNGDGTPDYTFCAARYRLCGKNLLLSVAASYLQAHGTEEGYLIDPLTGNTLTNSAGFVRAMEVWQELAAHSPPQDAARCGQTQDAFWNGTCLLTVLSWEAFKAYAGPGSAVRDVLGVAISPGSAEVLNRTSGNLERCTAALCPHAVSDQQQSTEGNASSTRVNHAPFMLGGLVGIVSSRNPQEVQEAVMGYFQTLSSAMGMQYVLEPGSYMGPFRTDQWSDAAMGDWERANYSAAALPAMQAALKQMYASPNLAPPLRLPGQDQVMEAVYNASAALNAGQSPGAVAANLDAAFKRILAARYPTPGVNGTPGYLQLYRTQLGYTVPEAAQSAQPPPSPPHRAATVSRQTVVVISVVLGLAALLAAVVAMEVRNKRHHKDLLGRVKPPLGDPDTTIVVAAIQDFDELWEALISDASERALQQFGDLVDVLLRRHSGYRASSEDEEVVAAFHCPRDACEFALELQRGLLELRWPRHVLEMEQFRPQYLAQTKRTSFSQSCTGQRPPALGGHIPVEDDDKLFSLDTAAENVRSFGDQCAASWTPAEPSGVDSELAFCGIRARVGLCAVGFSRLELEVEPGRRRYTFSGEAVDVAAAVAGAAQGGMVLIPQSTFRQLHLEVLAEHCLFCHLGEYQLTAELPPMDLYLALDRGLLGRLALFGPLSCYCQWSQGAFAAPVHSASMVFTHVVGVQTLLAWNYDLMQDVIETFTRLAQVELQQADGYLVEHVEGFMLTAFHSPAEAILWGLRMQELMLKEEWPEELLSHELCEEVTVTVPVRGGEVTSATVFRGPRLKTGIDIGQVLARLHTMTGRMTYRGKVMNRAARISAAASSGQVLCSAEAWDSCTAAASAAMRLVTATSLGLFQLKGIQERIEVFHCTYQRQMPSSTRRSSTVSVGIASSSDNRRKSALALSSVSHISHFTSHRTSQHTSAAVDTSMSASDLQRRASAASSAAVLPGVRGGSVMGGGQLADMLHLVGLDQAAAGVLGGGAVAAAAAAAMGPVGGSYPGAASMLATRSNRNMLVPLLGREGSMSGGGGSPAAAAVTGTPPGTSPLMALMPAVALTHMSQSSQRSNCSGSGGGNAPAAASRVALAAVLQSRTRSASAIHPNNHVVSMRSHSARARRHSPLAASGVPSSEPQTSVAVGSPLGRRPAGTDQPASPKAAAALEVPHRISMNSVSGLSGESGALSAGETKGQDGGSSILGGGGGTAAGGPGSTLLSGDLSRPTPEPLPMFALIQQAPSLAGGDSHATGHEHTIAAAAGGSAGVTGASTGITLIASLGRIVSSRGGAAVTAVAAGLESGAGAAHDEGPSLRDDVTAPTAIAANADYAGVLHTYQSEGERDADDGAQVETLDVTVSVNGIGRRALSGNLSSTGFLGGLGSGVLGALGSSNSRGFSRNTSTGRLQFIFSGVMAGGGGLASGASQVTGVGSQGSSLLGIPIAHASQARLLGAPGEFPLFVSPQPATNGLIAAGDNAGSSGGRHSGSVGSLEMFLPMPLQSGEGRDAGSGAESQGTNSRVANADSTTARAAAGNTQAGEEELTMLGLRRVNDMAAVPRRAHGSVHTRRLAAVARVMRRPGSSGRMQLQMGGSAEPLPGSGHMVAPPDDMSTRGFVNGVAASVTVGIGPQDDRGDVAGTKDGPSSSAVPDQSHPAHAATHASGRRDLSASAAVVVAGTGSSGDRGGGGGQSGSLPSSAPTEGDAGRVAISYSGGLRAARTASGIPHVAVASPSSPWISEYSDGSNGRLIVLRGAGSGASSAVSALAAGAAGVGVGVVRPKEHVLQLAGGGYARESGDTTMPGAGSSYDCSGLSQEVDGSAGQAVRDEAEQVDHTEAPAAAEVCERTHAERTDGTSVQAAAAADAFGVSVPPAEYAAAAAAFGVGPPPPGMAAAAACGLDPSSADFAAAAAFGIIPPAGGLRGILIE
ncbi:hypothetical protein GPECTOR_2g1153 [Gonium pectorale]|uniref:Guanylate cyclase domain-containing protein n=1 Tax=Gonium pectorale TaxID=33097 RepID=A0A150H0S3_GONPE|nr:hypothetical protein GPECTOR_2g1153 [Gonium pectorale]|eukprot:KXZ55603.1 hypothetical protein GPECTOR_2g1153 [Gonium pectorale]